MHVAIIINIHVFRYFLWENYEQHEEYARLGDLLAQIRTSDITNTKKNINHDTAMANINVRTQKREAYLRSYLFSPVIPYNPFTVNHFTHDSLKHHLFNSHQNIEADVTFKTNTFSSYQATKTTHRKNEQKNFNAVRRVILYGSCWQLKSLGGTGRSEEQQSCALMYLAFIIRKYHSIERQVLAVSPNSMCTSTQLQGRAYLCQCC